MFTNKRSHKYTNTFIHKNITFGYFIQTHSSCCSTSFTIFSCNVVNGNQRSALGSALTWLHSFDDKLKRLLNEIKVKTMSICIQVSDSKLKTLLK